MPITIEEVRNQLVEQLTVLSSTNPDYVVLIAENKPDSKERGPFILYLHPRTQETEVTAVVDPKWAGKFVAVTNEESNGALTVKLALATKGQDAVTIEHYCGELHFVNYELVEMIYNFLLYKIIPVDDDADSAVEQVIPFDLPPLVETNIDHDFKPIDQSPFFASSAGFLQQPAIWQSSKAFNVPPIFNAASLQDGLKAYAEMKAKVAQQKAAEEAYFEDAAVVVTAIADNLPVEQVQEDENNTPGSDE